MLHTATRLYLTILLPPLAVIMLRGRPGQVGLSVLLTLLLWVPGILYALLFAHQRLSEEQSERLTRTMQLAGPGDHDPVSERVAA